MKLKIIIISILSVLLLSNCEKMNTSSLPDEIIGEWTQSSSLYTLTFEFTKKHVYYHDYASNTGVGYDWDDDVSEVFDDESFKAGSYYYYFHVSGNMLYLIKDKTQKTLGNNWWDDENVVVGYRLTKK